MLKSGGMIIYYDVAYQPIQVRVGSEEYPSRKDIEVAVAKRNGRIERVFMETMSDPRMQNVALIGRLAAAGTIDGVDTETLESALCDAIPSGVREANLALFRLAAHQ